jgi:hypothetical protein
MLLLFAVVWWKLFDIIVTNIYSLSHSNNTLMVTLKIVGVNMQITRTILDTKT